MTSNCNKSETCLLSFTVGLNYFSPLEWNPLRESVVGVQIMGMLKRICFKNGKRLADWMNKMRPVLVLIQSINQENLKCTAERFFVLF